MEPSTSFMVVERSHQWKLLKQKEKQQLNAANGLEHDETLKTPTPSFWILLLVCSIGISLSRRKRDCLTEK
jgi:hypothetical protein